MAARAASALASALALHASVAHYASASHAAAEESSLLQIATPVASKSEDIPPDDPTYRSVVEQFLPPWAAGGKVGRDIYKKEITGRKATFGPKGVASTAKYWDAPIDHFALSSSKAGTFRQRYFDDKGFYKSGGPVFFQLGGEGAIGGPPGGFVSFLASERNALLVQCEHRFYGESVPNGNVDADNLKYLTVDQALADYAAFVDWYTEMHLAPDVRKTTKWFVFGGSYPGALASWFRIAYPEKSSGSLSSSGVVNSIFQFTLFDVHLARVMGEPCSDGVRRITQAFEDAILARGSRESGAKELMGAPADMADGDFFYMLADGFSMMVQYSHKSDLCSAMAELKDDDTPEALMRAGADLLLHFYGPAFGAGCFYDTACLKDKTRYEVGGTDRSWRWQKCYELAYFQPAPLPGQTQDFLPMPVSLRSKLVNMSYMVNQCYEVFGNYNLIEGALEFSTESINKKFGGARPHATKVFYSNFQDDPWLEASVMPPRDIAPDQMYEVAMCDDCGHCLDLHTPQPSDPPELQAVRERFTKFMDEIL